MAAQDDHCFKRGYQATGVEIEPVADDPMPVGRKGDADSGGEVKGDLTRIKRIEFAGTSRQKEQTCQMLWDDFNAD